MEVLYQKSDERNALLKHKTSALKAAEEVCGVSRGRPQQGETWWWNQDVQKAITEKRKSFKNWKQLPSRENEFRYVSDKKKAKRVVAEAVKEMKEIRNDRNDVFRRIKMMKKQAITALETKLEGCICGECSKESVEGAHEGHHE